MQQLSAQGAKGTQGGWDSPNAKVNTNGEHVRDSHLAGHGQAVVRYEQSSLQELANDAQEMDGGGHLAAF